MKDNIKPLITGQLPKKDGWYTIYIRAYGGLVHRQAWFDWFSKRWFNNTDVKNKQNEIYILAIYGWSKWY